MRGILQRVMEFCVMCIENGGIDSESSYECTIQRVIEGFFILPV